MLTSRCVSGPSILVGNIYELHTPDDGAGQVYDYNIITTRNEMLSFSVKACNDAHILLQSVPGSTQAKSFEVVLGGYNNTRSDIRDGVLVNILHFCDIVASVYLNI